MGVIGFLITSKVWIYNNTVYDINDKVIVYNWRK
jgi:hypothetical protein